jgi:hypothetical protein
MPGFLSFEGEIRGGRQFLSGPAISDAPALSPSDTCGLDYQCRPETRRFPLPPLAPVSRVDFQFAPTESIKVIRPEWHLLKLLGVAIFPDFLSGNRTGFDEERIGFWASLDGPGLKASGPIAHLPLRDQD